MKKTFYILFAFAALMVGALTPSTQAQNADKPSKQKCSVTVSSVVSNGIHSVKVSASYKNDDGKRIQVSDATAPLNLYLTEVKDHDATNGTGFIAKTFLNSEGEANFEFPADFNKLTSNLHSFTFIVTMNNDPRYKDVEEEITVSDVKIEITYNGKDSIKTASAKVLGWKDNAFVPVPEVELKLGVKRSFNALPFGPESASTDEKGEVAGELPLDLPGNLDGNLTIQARIEDNDTYGNVEVTKDVPWNVAQKLAPPRGRTLWSQGDNAPWLLVISALTIITLIWGTIFYLITQLIKIKKLSNE